MVDDDFIFSCTKKKDVYNIQQHLVLHARASIWHEIGEKRRWECDSHVTLFGCF